MDLKCSNTEKNLYKTFAGECRACVRYKLYAEKAREDGYVCIAKVYEDISKNELAHAREVYKKYLKKIKSTEKNLVDAALGEAKESEYLYKKFEKEAKEEGFEEISDFYEELSEVEEWHKEKFMELAKEVKDDTIFKCKENCKEKCYFECLNCGYIYEGEEAPEKCPLCKYPKSYFKKIGEK